MSKCYKDNFFGCFFVLGETDLSRHVYLVVSGNGGQCNPFRQRAWSVLREKQASIVFWIVCIQSDFFSSVGRVEFSVPSWYLVFVRRRHLAMNSGSFGTCSGAVKIIFLRALKSVQASWAMSNLLACLGIRSPCGQRKPKVWAIGACDF